MKTCIKVWLFVAFVLADDHCDDDDLGEACVQYCSTVNDECLDKCSGNRNCIEYCNSNKTKCINSCPCHGECADGCADCDSSFCQCVDPELNADFIKCERHFTDVYLECAFGCGSDLSCNSECARQFNVNIKQCPCQEKCPAGCPCPEYDCEMGDLSTTAAASTTTQSITTTRSTTTTSKLTTSTTVANSRILVVWYSGSYPPSNAVLTNNYGDVTTIQWHQEREATTASLCSLTFQNEFYILGQWFQLTRLYC